VRDLERSRTKWKERAQKAEQAVREGRGSTRLGAGESEREEGVVEEALRNGSKITGTGRLGRGTRPNEDRYIAYFSFGVLRLPNLFEMSKLLVNRS
jgi:hypothetical protein